MELPGTTQAPRHPDVPPLPCGVPWAVQQSHVLEEGTGYEGGHVIPWALSFIMVV